MSIEFTNGFSIIPNGTLPLGPGDYYLVGDYRPANNNGDITIPDHPNNTFSLDFNIVGGTYGAAIYINTFDSLGNDNSAYLNQLIGNHTHLTFSQNDYHIKFDCLSTAWYNTVGGPYPNQVYYDPTMAESADNSISIISTSGVPFNTTEVINITVEVI